MSEDETFGRADVRLAVRHETAKLGERLSAVVRENEELRRKVRALAEVAEYAQHHNWRCGHPDRFPWKDGDCRCELVGALRAAGLAAQVEQELAHMRRTVNERGG